MFRQCLIAIATLAAAASLAADPEHKPTAQQARFAECAHESKGLKGEERHHFLSECMKSHGSGDGAKHLATREDGAQPERTKSCTAEAAKKDLHGDDRRAFISACLKG